MDQQDEKAPEPVATVSDPQKFDCSACTCDYCGSKPDLFLHRSPNDAPLRSVCVDCFVKVFDQALQKPSGAA
jgi:hypothetical protein